MEYQQVAAACLSAAPSTAGLFLWGGSGLERCGSWMGGFVFGTLLGPETTGPDVVAGVFFSFGGGAGRLRGPGLVFLVSWLHR